MKKEINYPGLFDRIKAVTVDSLFIMIMIFIISDIFSNFDNLHQNARIIAFVSIFILYDPLFTSIFGGTIGHIIIGIRVKKEKNMKQNINFFSALIRYIIKYSLGWISLLSVSSNSQNKALHDKASNSIVLYVKNT